MRRLAVLVPRRDSDPARTIDKGSAIVANIPSFSALARNRSALRIEVYYEGNRYGFPSLDSFESKVLTAAGRLVKRYPTIAMGRWPLSDFCMVGTYSFSRDWREKQLTVTDPEELARWQHR